MKSKVSTFCLVMSFLMMAASVWATTIESSTLVFEGALTDAGGGVYTGTIDATAGSYYLPGGPGTVPDGG